MSNRFVFILIVLLSLVSENTTAQTGMDSLKIVIKNETDDSLKVLDIISLCKEMHKVKHNEEEEMQYAELAIKMATSLKDTILLAKAIDNLGLMYRFHQYYGKAIPLHIEAYVLVKNRKDAPSLSKMIFANNAGVAARYNQDYDLAVSYYMEALEIAKNENNLQNIAISSNGIGNALSSIPDREEEALDYFRQSLAAEEKRGNQRGIAMNYLSIADYYIVKTDFGEAKKYLDRLLGINEKQNDLYGLAITYEYLGKCYLEEGKDLPQALIFFENAFSRFKGLGDINKEADILYSLGNIKLRMMDRPSAKSYYEKSLNLAAAIDHTELRMLNSYKLAELARQQHKPELALQYFMQGKEFEDSLKMSEQNIKISAIIQKYDLKSKVDQIALLEKDKALHDSQMAIQRQTLNRRQFYLSLLSLGLLFILILSILQYRNLQTKKKAAAQIEKEEKARLNAIYERNLAQAEILNTRLQINPHFLFNCLNAIQYLIQSGQNQKAMKYLVVFSRYARIVLETSSKNVVPLSEELMLTKYYLTLEENRFGNEFSYQITDYDETEMGQLLIPPMLLQPFIENAIWHGLLPSKKERKVLSLELESLENEMCIVIDDNGVGRAAPTAGKENLNKSMGMQITRDRIDLYNKSNICQIKCDIQDKKDETGQPLGTRVLLYIRNISPGKMPG